MWREEKEREREREENRGGGGRIRGEQDCKLGNKDKVSLACLCTQTCSSTQCTCGYTVFLEHPTLLYLIQETYTANLSRHCQLNDRVWSNSHGCDATYTNTMHVLYHTTPVQRGH